MNKTYTQVSPYSTDAPNVSGIDSGNTLPVAVGCICTAEGLEPGIEPWSSEDTELWMVGMNPHGRDI